MEKSQRREKWNATDYRVALVEIKSLATVALRHLETVKSEDIPDDEEFRQILFTLLSGIGTVERRLDEMLETFHVPAVDDVVRKA